MEWAGFRRLECARYIDVVQSVWERLPYSRVARIHVHRASRSHTASIRQGRCSSEKRQGRTAGFEPFNLTYRMVRSKSQKKSDQLPSAAAQPR